MSSCMNSNFISLYLIILNDDFYKSKVLCLRRDPCCNGRIDDCSRPILGTLCYCDEFCNRTINPDCCPDYWEACLGIKPPSVLRKYIFLKPCFITFS